MSRTDDSGWEMRRLRRAPERRRSTSASTRYGRSRWRSSRAAAPSLRAPAIVSPSNPSSDRRPPTSSIQLSPLPSQHPDRGRRLPDPGSQGHSTGAGEDPHRRRSSLEPPDVGTPCFDAGRIGLGTLLSGARIISDGMLQAAGECLASFMKEEEVLQGIIYPHPSRIRDITKEVAAAVVREAVAEELAEGYRDMDARELAKLSEEETVEYVKNNMWNPVYPTVVYKKD